jgi:hypothetical protein
MTVTLNRPAPQSPKHAGMCDATPYGDKHHDVNGHFSLVFSLRAGEEESVMVTLVVAILLGPAVLVAVLTGLSKLARMLP